MIVYLICYAISFLLARQHFDMLSGLFLVLSAIGLYVREYRREKNLVALRGLFCLSFVGGQGLSCLKLSRLQTDWSAWTWLCFLLAVVGFWVAYEFTGKCVREREMREPKTFASARRILVSMIAITGLSVAAFAFEAVKLGFIPMFSYGVPHAYSTFHVSGVHYFTVSCVLVPSLFVLWLSALRGHFPKKEWALAIICIVVSVMIPLLCVSRFQLILAVGMAVFTFIAQKGTIRARYLVGIVCLMIPAYLGLTVLRSHSVSYLNGIFEMKNAATPIFVTQPYMYIANNYDNFNCLVEQLPAHTHGLRLLFPVWALSGLKFLRPELVSFPIYVTKEELTTVTLIYDAYYDFGAIGVLGFCAVLGAACALLTKWKSRSKNPVVIVIYAQIAMYMALAFFTTWFSNPTTWFYLAMTGAGAAYVGVFSKKGVK